MAELLNISMEKLRDYGDTVSSSEFLCPVIDNTYQYIFLPLLGGLLIWLLIRYKDQIMERYYMFFAKRGYVKIHYLMPNRRMKEKMKKLDVFNTFSFKNKRYSLENMHGFIVGYDKNNLPIFMYDNNFILPLKVTKKDIDDELRRQLADMRGVMPEEIEDKEISRFHLLIDSSILDMTYNRKLMKDLYEISKTKTLPPMLLYIIIGAGLLFVLYITGYLEPLIEWLFNTLGVQL